jgi:3-hydroxyacyl-CoA dehydrogenase
MKYHIHKAVVIGSGTMGAAIAAHLANAGVPVTLLDIAPKDVPAEDREARDMIVREGWARCLKAKPANLMSADLMTFVKLGNLEDDFGCVAEADWVCEAIVENLEIKRELMARIDEVRKPHLAFLLLRLRRDVPKASKSTSLGRISLTRLAT